MELLRGQGQPLIVAGQAAKTSGPPETTFHYPAAGQEHKTRLPRWLGDYLQVNSVCRRDVGVAKELKQKLSIGHLVSNKFFMSQ